MGKITGNVITKGFSGKFGDDLVFRQLDKKTVFARKSVSTKAPSAEQISVRNKFTDAAYYASAAVDNPILLEEYTQMAELQELKSPYLAAVTDYLTQPEIGKVVAVLYTGKVGDMINISSKSAYKITEIDVTILAPDGTVLETGKAQQSFQKFRYVATVLNPSVAGSTIVLKARDRQGKVLTTQVVLS